MPSRCCLELRRLHETQAPVVVSRMVSPQMRHGLPWYRRSPFLAAAVRGDSILPSVANLFSYASPTYSFFSRAAWRAFLRRVLRARLRSAAALLEQGTQLAFMTHLEVLEQVLHGEPLYLVLPAAAASSLLSMVVGSTESEDQGQRA